MSNNETFKLGQLLPNFSGLNPKEIEDNLELNCYGKEEGSYQKNLSEAELGKAKSDYADVGISISKIETEKKEAMDEFKRQLITPKAKQANLLKMLKHKSIEMEGILYLFDDVDNGMMYKVDESGVIVDVRPMQQKEKQTVIRQLKAVNE